MKKIFTTQLTKGFTIIETLVAITILMIAIAGPLTIAHKGLLAALYAHEQVTASYLAVDAIEYVKNVRDNNMISKSSSLWLDGLAGGVGVGCTKASPCSVDTVGGSPSANYPANGITNCVNSCVLYKASNGSGYTYDPSSGNVKTQFIRYFYVTNPGGNQGDETKLTVIVKWKNGTIDNVFAFENELFRVTR